MIRLSGCLLALLGFAPVSLAAETAPAPRAKPQAASTAKLALTGLAPAKPMLDACVYRYSVSTTDPHCQELVDQGLGMYYSYVWIEAARSFETALQHDPDCAYAWLMLIGEQPGDQEDRQGAPFVGPAGRVHARRRPSADGSATPQGEPRRHGHRGQSVRRRTRLHCR